MMVLFENHIVIVVGILIFIAHLLEMVNALGYRHLIAVGADLVLANGKVVPVEEYVLSLADNLILNVRLPLNVRAGMRHPFAKRRLWQSLGRFEPKPVRT